MFFAVTKIQLKELKRPLQSVVSKLVEQERGEAILVKFWSRSPAKENWYEFSINLHENKENLILYGCYKK